MAGLDYNLSDYVLMRASSRWQDWATTSPAISLCERQQDGRTGLQPLQLSPHASVIKMAGLGYNLSCYLVRKVPRNTQVRNQDDASI
jgi:hypothetical protein